MEWKAFDDARLGEAFETWEDGDAPETTTQTQPSDRDAILFMIDCQEAMFVPNAEGELPFTIAVQCCMRFYKDKIMSSANDYVGVLLYSTKHKLNAYDFDGIYIFHTLAPPSAPRIKELESLMTNREGFIEHVGSAPPISVNDALWTAQHLFYTLPKRIAYKRVVVFTNDDNPARDDPSMRDKCISRAKDLAEADVALQLFAIQKGLPHGHASASPPTSRADESAALSPSRGTGKMSTTPPVLQLSMGASLSLSGQPRSHPNPAGSGNGATVAAGRAADPAAPFCAALFWRDLMYAEEEEGMDRAIHLDAKSSFQDMLEPLKRKAHQKRSNGQVMVGFGRAELDLEPTMAVKIFHPLVRATKGSTVNLDAKTNTPLTTETRYICRNTADILTPDDIEHAVPVGNERVMFSAAEVAKLKDVVAGPPGLRILGFKPRSRLKASHQLQPALFLRPDERIVRGSTKAFQALVQKMHEKDKVAVAHIIARRGTMPRLAALVPQLETTEVDGSIDESFGLHVVMLPYADDVRQLAFPPPNPERPANHAAMVTKAKQIIKRMQLQPVFEGGESRYDPVDYPNPALQKHFTALQSIALEEDYEQVQDYTLPDYASMEGFRSLFTSFRDLAYAQGYNPAAVTNTAGAKRKLSDYEGRDPKKVDIRDVDFVQRYEAGTLAKLTVPVLRQFCKDRHEETKGQLKVDLVATVAAIVRADLEQKKNSATKDGQPEE